MLFPSRIYRLSRAQFLPVILSPVLVGSAVSWCTGRLLSPVTFALMVLGSITAHLAANAIDDAYDYTSGVDKISNDMFPPDFGGWKVLPRGLVTLGQAKLTAYLLFSAAILVGLYLTVLAGPLVLLLGTVGLFFAYFHVAPPLRLGYRGLGLSEIGVFLSFGILPVVGAFYVQSGFVSFASVMSGVPLGLLTASILINHDQIFYDAYMEGGKRSFTVTAGRRTAMATTFGATLVSYFVVTLAVLLNWFPIMTLLVFLTLPLFLVQSRLYLEPAQSPLHYVKLTQVTFALSVVFGLLLAIGFIVG